MEENYCLRWERHNENFLKTVENFYKKTALIDVTLACEGKLYPAHKLILSSCSEYFSFIFENTSPRENLIVVLNDIPSRTLEYLLEFIYMGEINVKQTELSPLIRAAQCLKIKGLVASDICFSDYGALHLSEPCNDTYTPIDSTVIKPPTSKGSEAPKSFLIEEQVQVMPEYPVIYSQVKLESVNKNRISVNDQGENLVEVNNQTISSEAELKARETSEKNTYNSKSKKLKVLLQKQPHDGPTTHNFTDGHTIFLPIEDDGSSHANQNQVNLLRPMQEINYEKEDGKSGSGISAEESVIFTEMINANTNVKHSEASSSQKRITETLLSNSDCTVVFEQPIPIQSDQGKISVNTINSVPQVGLNHTLIVPPPQTSDSASVKDGSYPRILKTSDGKKNSKPSRKYLCSECSYSSDFSSNVRRHIRKHTGEKPYKCTICNINFASSGKFKSHLSSVHNS